MGMFSANKFVDPKLVLKILQELREQLQAALKENLVSLIVYGDFVKVGEYDPRRSNISLMLVLTNVSTGILDLAIAPILSAEQKLRNSANRLSVMTLTEEDIEQSCDVFPIKFVDMQENHRLLCGRDVLSGLKIGEDHLRLRCEQELKNMMIRLRFEYLHKTRNSEKLQTVLTESIGALLQLLTIGLTLKTGKCPKQNEEILAAIKNEFELDITVLKTVLDLKHRVSKLATNEVRTVFNDYMKVVHNAASQIDRLEVTT